MKRIKISPMFEFYGVTVFLLVFGAVWGYWAGDNGWTLGGAVGVLLAGSVAYWVAVVHVVKRLG